MTPLVVSASIAAQTCAGVADGIFSQDEGGGAGDVRRRHRRPVHDQRSGVRRVARRLDVDPRGEQVVAHAVVGEASGVVSRVVDAATVIASATRAGL